MKRHAMKRVMCLSCLLWWIGVCPVVLAQESAGDAPPPLLPGGSLVPIVFTGAAPGDYFGLSVACAGDLNGDGFDDMIVGAAKNDDDAFNAGRAYVCFGGNSIDLSADLILPGTTSPAGFGSSVAGAGDVNGDGYDDVIVGETDADRAYIYFGGPSMNSTVDVTLAGEPGTYFGSSVAAAGDVNADGYDDVIVGACLYNSSGGRAYVYLGGSSMNSSPDVVLSGEAAGDYFGWSAGTAGDVNMDGYDDVVVGAFFNDAGGEDAGRSYLYFGGTSMNNTPDLVMTGAAAGDYFGFSVAAAGDVNSDGYSDLIVGAWAHDSGAGRAYVYYGGASMNNTADVITSGAAPDDNFGYSVAAAGDVNADGYGDVLVGVRGSDQPGEDAGSVEIFLGGAPMDNSPDVTLRGNPEWRWFGYDVSPGGDANGDGVDDILVGAGYYWYEYPDPGRAYLFLSTILANPGFESGPDPWVFYTNGTGTFAAQSPGFNSPRAGHLAVSAPGTNTQLYQGGVILEPRTKYRLTIDAYSTGGRNMRVAMHKHGTPYTSYGLNWVPDLSGSWRTLSTEFITTGFSSIVDDARLRFSFNGFATAGDRYHIDNVRLEKIANSSPVITAHPEDRTVLQFQTATFTVAATGAGPLSYQWQKNDLNIPGATGTSYTTPPVSLGDDGTLFRCVVTNPFGAAYSTRALLHVLPGVNVVRNPGFESATDEWSFYTNGAGTFATYPHSNANGERCAGVFISSEGTNVQVLQTGIPLESSRTYRLAFSAYSNTGHNMAVFLQKHSAPYTNYGVSNWIVDLTPGWQSHEKTFTTSGFVGTTTDTRLRFWLAPFDAAGDRFYIDDVWLGKAGTAKERAGTGGAPTVFALHQNFPNPFNPVTTIRFALPASDAAAATRGVSLQVFDLLGREVATLVEGELSPGEHEASWDASGMPSGVYYYRLSASGIVQTRKLMLLR